MKILTLDHIGIAVEKIDASLPVWEGILGLPLHGIEEVAEQKVKTAFIPLGESEIELLETTDPEGPIGNSLRRRQVSTIWRSAWPTSTKRWPNSRPRGCGSSTRRLATARVGHGLPSFIPRRREACLSSSANERKIRPNLMCPLF